MVATIYDANHKQVGTTEVEFRTTGTPDNAIQKDVIIAPYDVPRVTTVEIEIEDISDDSVLATAVFRFLDYVTEYSLSCDKGGVFSETGRFTADKTLTLSNLNYGTEYTITATLYNPASGATKDISNKFTKK